MATSPISLRLSKDVKERLRLVAKKQAIPTNIARAAAKAVEIGLKVLERGA